MLLPPSTSSTVNNTSSFDVIDVTRLPMPFFRLMLPTPKTAFPASRENIPVTSLSITPFFTAWTITGKTSPLFTFSGAIISISVAAADMEATINIILIRSITIWE
ncbi:hypothetical protein ES708_04149 [subsurface metagenome]